MDQVSFFSQMAYNTGIATKQWRCTGTNERWKLVEVAHVHMEEHILYDYQKPDEVKLLLLRNRML